MYEISADDSELSFFFNFSLLIEFWRTKKSPLVGSNRQIRHFGIVIELQQSILSQQIAEIVRVPKEVWYKVCLDGIKQSWIS